MANSAKYIVQGGECGDRIRAIDWSKTELGPLESWSQALLANVNTILNSPLAFVLICNQGGYLIYNDAYARFAGSKHPAILGQNYAQAWPEIADYNRDMSSRINGGETISYKERVLSLKRGNSFEDVYLDLNYSPTFDSSGAINAMLVSVVEVTDSVKAKVEVESALREIQLQKQKLEDSLQLNRTITENASTAMFTLNSRLQCTFMNPAAKVMTGYNLKDFKKDGITLHDLIHHSHPDGSSYKTADCPITEAMQQLQVTAGEEVFIRKDGSYFPVYFVASPVVKDGKLVSVILEVRDMSDTEELVELNRAKDDFIAMASHQLRTPATSVKQYLGILMAEYSGPINEDQLQYLQITYNANERQLKIIEDLLKTAQVDTKGFRLTLRPANISQLVRESAQSARDMLSSKKQHIVTELSTTDISAKVGRPELAICLDNLIENASKYSAPGTTITVSAKAHPSYIEISVEDQGVGIEPGDREKIFEKFTRVNNILSDTVSGNGLGLYWVKRVVDLHKGKIIIKSKLGVGTAFTIRLPR